MLDAAIWLSDLQGKDERNIRIPGPKVKLKGLSFSSDLASSTPYQVYWLKGLQINIGAIAADHEVSAHAQASLQKPEFRVLMGSVIGFTIDNEIFIFKTHRKSNVAGYAYGAPGCSNVPQPDSTKRGTSR